MIMVEYFIGTTLLYEIFSFSEKSKFRLFETGQQ